MFFKNTCYTVKFVHVCRTKSGRNCEAVF